MAIIAFTPISLQALRVSMEEQRARQEAEARKAVSESAGADSAAAQTGKLMVLTLFILCLMGAT